MLALPKPSMAAPSQKHAESWNRPRAPRVLQLQPHDLFDDRFVLPTPSPALVGADPIPSRNCSEFCTDCLRAGLTAPTGSAEKRLLR